MSIKLLSPKNNESICTIKDIAKKYIDNMHAQVPNDLNDYFYNGVNYNLKKFVSIDDYYKKVKFRDSSKKIIFKFNSSNNCKHNLIISLDKKMNKKVVKFVTKKNFFAVDSLEVNKKYYWKIVDDNEESEVQSFFVENYPRVIPLGYLVNVRDFGGRLTKYGKYVKQGLLFRGPELTPAFYEDDAGHKHNKNLTKKNVGKLRTLIKNGIDLDFRGDVESNYITKSPLKSKNNHIDYIRLEEYGAYDQFFILDKPILYDQIKQAFEIISNADKKPVYMHCAAGADRTGTTAFMLGAILGMSYTDLICDYEYTTFSTSYRNHYIPLPEFRNTRFYEMLQEMEIYVKKHNLSNELDKIIEHLLINRFDIKKTTIDKIRKIFLE